MIDLHGRHAIVTGASRGLGVGIARALAAAGADVTLAARSGDELETTRAHLLAHGVRVLAVPTDVTLASDRERLVERARSGIGPVDILVNNAGIEGEGWFVDATPATIDAVVAVNLTAALQLTRLVLPEMLERARGSIVNVSSLSGKSGAPFLVAYSATKAGLLGATEALRAELSGTGVGVSAICPGFVEREGMYARTVAESGARASCLLGSTTPEKVAGAVCKAIERDAPELIVTARPFRVLRAIAELVPDIVVPVTRALVYPQMRTVADERRRRAESS